MKILILGSEGFVGHTLVKGLNQTHEVSTADIFDISSPNYSKFDVTDRTNVNEIVKDVDVVIDLVAHSLVSSLDDTRKNAQVNIMGLLNILDACRKNDIKKIVFTSASSIVGEPKQYSVNEDHTLKPKTAYGITKMTSEHYLRLFNELYGINFVIFRFFNIYGPFQINGLIPILFNRITKKQPITIFGAGDQVRDYVYVEDIIPIFDKSCTQSIGNNDVFNIGTGRGNTINEIVSIMTNILELNPILESKPERPGEIGNFVANTDKLFKTFQQIPNTTIEEGLRKTISWLETQK